MNDPPAAAAEIVEQLTAVLQAMEAGELAGSAPTRHRIEGAVIALGALGGAGSDELIRLLGVQGDPE